MNMNEQMRKIGRSMSIKMGVTMSFFLSLIGMGTSGHFTIPGFIISFVVSTILSLIIGMVIPMGRISDAAVRSLKLQKGTFPARALETVISDLIYTPIMTLSMVSLAYNMAMRQSGGKAQLNFAAMFFPSLIIGFLAGLVIIFIIQPVFFKQTMKKYGVGMSPEKK